MIMIPFLQFFAETKVHSHLFIAIDFARCRDPSEILSGGQVDNA
jgi:hypothetical protein